jgi:lipopolysaccharide transport system ATP-binding protein
MSRPAIVFDRVCKTYPRYAHVTGGLKHFLLHFPRGFKSMRAARYLAFSDVSFAVDRGETLGIIGRNGAGKSTILGLIAGVLKPSAGEVRVNGRVSPLLELGAGFSHELTGIENIILNGVLLGLTKRTVLKKMEEIIAFSGLADFIDQPIRVYSSGMLARLGFAIVAHLEPDILLIDEILAVGDLDFQAKCIQKIKEFKQQGVTIVLVSHSMSDVERLCDRALWIEGHKLQCVGRPKDVIVSFTNYQLTADRPAHTLPALQATDRQARAQS